jgi:DNA (cytosine-5)-methyltransferase 1
MLRALDLFCGAGGASMGLHRAGFDLTGVDIKPQPHYPFKFEQADAMEFPLDGYDLIWASPPCQAYVNLSRKNGHPKLIEPIREKLKKSKYLYVIENVVGAPLESPILLCGSMFGLNVRRHRLFESNFLTLTPGCRHELQDEIRAYYGKKGWLVWTPKFEQHITLGAANVQKRGRKPLLRGSVEKAPADMGIDWMQTWDELREAIPPAYAQWIGERAIEAS